MVLIGVGEADREGERVERCGEKGGVDGSNVTTKLGYRAEVGGGVSGPENHPNREDQVLGVNISEGDGGVGVVVDAMEGGVDVVFVEQDVLVGMREAKVPDVLPMTDEGGAIVDGRVGKVVGAGIGNGVVSSPRVGGRQTGRGIDDDATLTPTHHPRHETKVNAGDKAPQDTREKEVKGQFFFLL